MNAFPMFVLPLNSLVTTKIIMVEITRPITKMTEDYLILTMPLQSRFL